MSRQKKTIERPFPNDLNAGILFLGMVVKHYSDSFEINGAVKLNRMLHTRSSLNQEKSFALIADSLAVGLLVFDKKNSKRLTVDEDIFRVWRDVFSFNAHTFQSYVASPRWPIAKVRRELTEIERQCLIKNVMKGRLFQKKRFEPDKYSDDSDWSVI